MLAVLLPLTFALAELLRYMRFTRHMASASESVAALVASRTGALTGLALTQDSSALADLFAEATAPLGAAWREGLGIQATLVRFAPEPASCTLNCGYPIGSVVWTWTGGLAASRALLQNGRMLRGCGSLTPSVDARPGAKALTQSAFGPEMRLVIDLVYPFKPMLVSDVLSAHPMVAVAHQPTQADLSNVIALADEVTTCP